MKNTEFLQNLNSEQEFFNFKVENFVIVQFKIFKIISRFSLDNLIIKIF